MNTQILLEIEHSDVFNAVIWLVIMLIVGYFLIRSNLKRLKESNDDAILSIMGIRIDSKKHVNAGIFLFIGISIIIFVIYVVFTLIARQFG
ncbi:MAG: hypothetical protein WCL14_08715 [Bacteroidota bacterium]